MRSTYVFLCYTLLIPTVSWRILVHTLTLRIDRSYLSCHFNQSLHQNNEPHVQHYKAPVSIAPGGIFGTLGSCSRLSLVRVSG